MLALFVLLTSSGMINVLADEAEPATYTFKYSKSDITLDASVTTGEEWDTVEWTALQSSLNTPNEGYSARFKGMWKEVEGVKRIYYFIEINDTTISTFTNWCGDAFFIILNDEGTLKNTATLNLKTVENATVALGTTTTTYTSSDTRATDGTYRVEGYFPIADVETFLFDVLVQDAYDDSASSTGKYARFAWNKSKQNDVPPTGTGVLGSKFAEGDIDETADTVFYIGETAVASFDKNAEGKVTVPATIAEASFCAWKNRSDNKLYAPGTVYTVTGTETVKFDAVSPKVKMRDGASVRLSGTTAMKFQASITDYETYSSIISKVGIVIVETSLLTDDLLSAGVTPKTLTTANIPFTKCESDKAETFEGILEGIEDCEKVYSALPYLVVTMSDGSTVEYAGIYSAENNSRSVKNVVEIAYADRVLIKSQTYCFRIGKELGTTGFERNSYSLYTREQLAYLKKLADTWTK